MTKDFHEFFDGLNDIVREGFSGTYVTEEPETEKPPRLTKRQAAIIGAYTGYVIGPFGDIHAYIEEILGRPVWTHELGSQAMQDEVTEKSKADYIALGYIPEEATDE